MMMKNSSALRDDGSTRGSREPNRLKIDLGKEAVQLALSGNWARAAEVNRASLKLHPNDCEAANRLAKALMELGEFVEARRVLKSLCVCAPNNAIARKNLIRLQKLESAATQQHKPAEQRTDLAHNFIEKGGKSCTTTLRQTGDPGLLASGTAGDAVVLTLQDTRVLVRNQHGGYLGSLDPRLARRLRKLISGGNRYSAVVRGTDAQGLSIILRETTQHASMRNVVSFPTGGRQVSASRLPDPYPDGDIPRNPWDADTAPSETPDSQSDVDRENEAANLIP
jgi:hypothetical protein